jgi:tRNA modification GTPase
VILLNKSDISEVNKNVSIVNYIVSLLDSKGVISTLAEERSEVAKIESTGEKVLDSNVQIIPISAKTGSGIDILRAVLADSQRDLLADSDTTLVTNQRHAQALSDARTSLLRVREGLATGLPTDLAAQDIREAIYSLGSIVGEISTDEVLGNIFRNFCIGK